MGKLGIEDLKKISEKSSIAGAIRSNEENDTKVVVHMGTCGIASGARKVMNALKEIVDEKKLNITLDEAGCLGICEREPIMTIISKTKPVVRYAGVTPEAVREIIESHIIGKKVLDKYLLANFQKGAENITETSPSEKPAVFSPEWEGPLKDLKEIDFFMDQRRITRKNCGAINPYKIDEYIAMNGWTALAKALSEMTPEEALDEIKDSGLRGRGGAGFPTGRKWELCRQVRSDTKYIICNADEGDPGAFMDRSQLEGDPQSILEGMAIASYAIGANKGIIYVRAEYPLAVELISNAIDQAREYGLLGDDIFGKGLNFDVEVMIGAGAFVCGEETALIHSVEGRRGTPRPKPPFPAISGLYGKPTIINNVETFAAVPFIIQNGSKWHSGLGSETSKGTKIFSLAGKITNNGLVEVEMGTSVEKLVYDIGGGVPNGGKFKALQCGGPSGGCISINHLDTPIDYESLTKLGAIMGSGGLVVMDESTCMVDTALYFLEFVQEESCGQCTPCRDGIGVMLGILTRITEGEGREEDIEQLQKIGEMIKKTALCGLGQTAPNPVLSTIRHFRPEYEAHIKDKKCPALRCRALITYSIDPETCILCGKCQKECPNDAIEGVPKKKGSKGEPFRILIEKCIKCGNCYSVCPTGSVLRT
ncbi:MAG: NADH-quinone oxidoreductase subunit NuoF [Desulfobulbaceae bacterium]|nr:NADH-quinone oxidoreductase subunit NuoF [Desulfobulbaceae bacterium]MCK5322875.1 NADH-quinone oxidoreductase subunit NuoF [Desulfobulbaceae bacterium]